MITETIIVAVCQLLKVTVLAILIRELMLIVWSRKDDTETKAKTKADDKEVR